MPIMLGISPPFTSPRCSGRSARSPRKRSSEIPPLTKITISLRIGTRNVGFISEKKNGEIIISVGIHDEEGKPEHC